ncbi:MAG: cupin domain-containing protein [Proteobacteria bacterium]|nr:cupin domain-containing protein [Pseudomonadota bacterium]MDA0951188.1 cupin domain-containing protein [Pseudomonadota bacterium]MDA1071605.1 cupin domain-containing protein [Pseudomonadota bacterium]
MTLPVKFSPNGPEGWMAKPDVLQETAKLVDGLPMGNDHVYFDRVTPKFRAGIWRSQPHTEWYDSYATDEFMVVLEGEVTLENDDFRETYRKGNAFFVPKGFRGFWRQTQPMLKYYVIIE